MKSHPGFCAAPVREDGGTSTQRASPNIAQGVHPLMPAGLYKILPQSRRGPQLESGL